MTPKRTKNRRDGNEKERRGQAILPERAEAGKSRPTPGRQPRRQRGERRHWRRHNPRSSRCSSLRIQDLHLTSSTHSVVGMEEQAKGEVAAVGAEEERLPPEGAKEDFDRLGPTRDRSNHHKHRCRRGRCSFRLQQG